MTRKHTPVYRCVGCSVYRTTGQADAGNGGEDLEFVRSFASREAALNWLWTNHPVQ